MPGYNRAEISAELTVVTSAEAEKPPREQIEAAKQAASDSGLTRPAPRPRCSHATARRCSKPPAR